MKLKEYKYKINGIKFNVGIGEVTDNKVHVEVNGTPYDVELDRAPATSSMPQVKKPTAAPRTETGEKVIATPKQTSSAHTVKSPLPGTINNIKVTEGQTVKAGETVCVLEAMKMDNDIHCTNGGTVKKIFVKVGDAVPEGGDLMIIE